MSYACGGVRGLETRRYVTFRTDVVFLLENKRTGTRNTISSYTMGPVRTVPYMRIHRTWRFHVTLRKYTCA